MCPAKKRKRHFLLRQFQGWWLWWLAEEMAGCRQPFFPFRQLFCDFSKPFGLFLRFFSYLWGHEGQDIRPAWRGLVECPMPDKFYCQYIINND
ncbi:hypothetical protein [Bacteroides sp. An269]|uniref:hypothetical protein n=1 Tax=Bacteroides sp. An269 TaxID=1965613 RepID=UPI0013028CF2|nr:hypothetical protein [Bacteroides sp. An269]